MRRDDRQPTRWGLPVAVIVSLLFHVLLVVLSIWMPLRYDRAEAAVAEPSELHFNFAPEVSDDALRESTRGEVPGDPQPARPAVQPTPPLTLPQNAPSVQPDEPASLSPPTSPSPMTPPQEAEQQRRPEEPRPQETEQREHSKRTPSETEPEQGDPRGEPAHETGLAPAEDGTLQGSDRPAGAQRRQGDSFDLQRALESYRRAMASRPMPDGAPSTPGGGSPTNVFRPELSELPSTGFGVGNLVFETRDFDWSDYARQIYQAIWRAWHNRLYQTTDDFNKEAFRTGQWYLDNRNQIRFTIERSGEVTGIAIETPSGWVPLDASATDALAEVILPPLPDAFPKRRETVHATFLAVGPVQYMRQTLTALKRAGLF